MEIPPSYRIGHLVVDGHVAEVTANGKPVPLNPLAFGVLYQLVQRMGHIVLKNEFEPWRDQYHVGRNPVDLHVMEIRKQLGEGIVITEHSRGYRLSPDFPVETIPCPSLSALEKRLTIALNEVKAHRSSSLAGVIDHYEELCRTNRIAEGYALIILAYINLGHVGIARRLHKETISSARKIIAEAFRLFPEMGSTFALRGLTYLLYEFDWQQAERDFKEALKRSPLNELAHCFLAHLQVAQGRFEEGLAHAQIAAEVDYDSPMTVATVPWLTLFAGRVAEAVRVGNEVAKNFPDFAPAHHLLGDIYCSEGDLDKAIAQYEKSLEIDFLPPTVASLGFVYGRRRDRKNALRQLARLEEAERDKKIAYVSGYCEALVRAGLRENGRCMDALERAFKERCDWLIYLAVEPRWKELRSEQRFHKLLHRVGLQPLIWD
jgi:tetratricopeptide (TPR) repeat protein